MLLRLFVLVVLLSFTSTALAQDGFNFGEAKFCPPYRCPKKDQEPVMRWPLALQSMGCTSMGGGMQMMTPGSSDSDVHESCCSLRDACLQLCGSIKTYCDEQFTKCTASVCEAIEDEEKKKKCDQSANLHGIMLKLDQCQKYDGGQKSHCECVAKESAPQARERVLRAFYKKYNPENIEKAPSLAAKADTPTKMVGLLLKLLKKYPQAIKKVKDPQQEYMEKIMRESKMKDMDKSSEEETEEGDVEDLGTEEL